MQREARKRTGRIGEFEFVNSHRILEMKSFSKLVDSHRIMRIKASNTVDSKEFGTKRDTLFNHSIFINPLVSQVALHHHL